MARKTGVLVLIALLIVSVRESKGSKDTRQMDTNFIISGVNEITKVSLSTITPGFLTIHSENAFPVLVGENGKVRKPIVGGARYFGGRIVAFTHTTFFITAKAERDNDRLLENSITWAANKNATTSLQVNIGVFVFGGDVANLKNSLNRSGIVGAVHTLSSGNINANFLKKFDVLLVSLVHQMTAAQFQIVREYIKSGGGVITSATPWSHKSPPGEDFRKSFSGNKLLIGTGMMYIHGYAAPTSKTGYPVYELYLTDADGATVWKDIKRTLRDNSLLEFQVTKKQLFETLRDRLRGGVKDETLETDIIVQLLSVLEDRISFNSGFKETEELEEIEFDAKERDLSRPMSEGEHEHHRMVQGSIDKIMREINLLQANIAIPPNENFSYDRKLEALRSELATLQYMYDIPPQFSMAGHINLNRRPRPRRKHNNIIG